MATENEDLTSVWTVTGSGGASGDTILRGSRGGDIEYAFTDNSTAPSEETSGYLFPPTGAQNFNLDPNEHMWVRNAKSVNDSTLIKG